MSDESLFREVDEEVRRDELEKLWKRHGNLFIAACVGVVLGVAGIKGWQYWQQQASEQAGSEYVAAVQLASDGKPAEATEAFARIAGGSHKGYAMLARLHEAGLKADAGENDEAVRLFDAIAADASADGAMRDLARVRAAYILADTASVDDLKSRLAGLDVEGNSWKSSAREILALAEYRAGNLEEADRLVKQLLFDPATPAGVRQRATLFDAMLKPKLDGKAAQ